jgi:hypothetical protein
MALALDEEVAWALGVADRVEPRMVLMGLWGRRRRAFLTFLKRYHRDPWLHGQRGALERACLIVTSRALDDATVERILYCVGSRYKCWTPRLCPKCSLDQRVEPLLEELGGCFGAMPHWYFVTVGARVRPGDAALRLNGRVLCRPPAGLPKFPRFTTYEDGLARCDDLVRALFALPAAMVRCGWISGAFSTLEPHVRFWLTKEGAVAHALDLHVHCAVCSSAPMTPRIAREAYGVQDRLLARVGVGAYPKLWIKRIEARPGGGDSLATCLGYGLKPEPIGKWYVQARRQGCPPAELSAVFDEVVFHNLYEHLARVRSVRRIGNLRAASPSYIGVRLPPMPTKREVRLWNSSAAYRAANPELEASIDRLMIKSAKRRGRHPLRTPPEEP